jgi:hypothetical protein
MTHREPHLDPHPIYTELARELAEKGEASIEESRFVEEGRSVEEGSEHNEDEPDRCCEPSGA